MGIELERAKFGHLTRIGRGRRAYYRLGQFQDSEKQLKFDIGVRFNYDIQTNAIQLLFCESTRIVLGFILLEIKDLSCALRGMKTSENVRGKGLSYVFVACWLEICKRLNVQPSANRIDKPLICLVLTKFGFKPLKKAFQCEIANDPVSKSEKLIWVPEDRRATMTTILSRRLLKNQNLRLVLDKPASSTTICIGSEFVAPEADHLDSCINDQINGKVIFEENAFESNLFSPDFFNEVTCAYQQQETINSP
mmetsp:Transcript_9632/g.10971  ORF Transcript_9632/g.10971 Transcript_9632/m.10971 type:complete len:251 (+) Transcript_9632:167-919(+)